MKTMKSANILQDLKAEDFRSEHVAGIPIEELLSGMTAWAKSGVKFEDPYLAEDDRGYDIDLDSLYSGCTFSPERWISNLGFVPQSGFLIRLMDARLIYPDGTYNKAWAAVALQELHSKKGEKS